MDRALAYIAHGEGPHTICPLFGRGFGTIYDVSTILILWFAGASAITSGRYAATHSGAMP